MSGRRAWLTSDTLPTTEFICRRLYIPNDVRVIANVSGALLSLCEEWNWEQFGAVTVEATVRAMTDMLTRYYEESACMLGAIVLYATSDTPQGTLPCDGSTHNRVDYPSLYAVLDAEYIVDADHFVTPNPPSYVGLNYFIVAR